MKRTSLRQLQFFMFSRKYRHKKDPVFKSGYTFEVYNVLGNLKDMRRQALEKEFLKEKVQAQTEIINKKQSMNKDIFEFFERKDQEYMNYCLHWKHHLDGSTS